MGLGRLEAAAPQEQADGGGSGRRWRHSGDGRRERMGRRASGGQWGSVSGVGLGRGGLEKGAPRRAELGSHGNGGRGALGVCVEGWNALNRKGRRGGRAGTQRPGGDLSREGNGEVAGCATPSAVCHAGRRRGRVPLARAARGDG